MSDDFEIPVDSVDPESVTGFDKVEGGGYHASIVSYDTEGGKKGEMVVDFEILSGTTPNQEGKVHREFFKKEAKEVHVRKLLALAYATGALTPESAKQAKARGESVKPNWSGIVGRQVCFNLERTEFPEGSGSFFTRVVWSEIYAVTDRKAFGIPKNAGMLKRAGIELPAAAVVGNAGPKPNPVTGSNGNTATKPAASAAPAADPLGGVDLSVV